LPRPSLILTTDSAFHAMAASASRGLRAAPFEGPQRPVRATNMTNGVFRMMPRSVFKNEVKRSRAAE